MPLNGLISNRTMAASAAILAPLAVALGVPVVTNTGGVPAALAAPADDLSNDGTQPAPAPAPDPGPGGPDDLSNDGTQPAPAPAPDPGPGSPDDLSNDGTQPPPPPPPDPVPGSPDDLSNESAAPPPASPAQPTGNPPGTSAPSGGGGPTGQPPGPTPASPGKRPTPRVSIRLKAPSRVTRKALGKGVIVSLTAKGPVHVVVTLRGPGRRTIRTRATLRAGIRQLRLRPQSTRSGRTLTLVVTATAPGTTGVTLRKTIRIRG
jgi:hypothetical protein